VSGWKNAHDAALQDAYLTPRVVHAQDDFALLELFIRLVGNLVDDAMIPPEVITLSRGLTCC